MANVTEKCRHLHITILNYHSWKVIFLKKKSDVNFNYKNRLYWICISNSLVNWKTVDFCVLSSFAFTPWHIWENISRTDIFKRGMLWAPCPSDVEMWNACNRTVNIVCLFFFSLWLVTLTSVLDYTCFTKYLPAQMTLNFQVSGPFKLNILLCKLMLWVWGYSK